MTVECECKGEFGGGGTKSDLSCAFLFEQEECGSVGEGIGAGGDGYVVAAEFALLTEAGSDPPDGGVEEEEGFDHGLEDVPEIVGATDVGEFVGEDSFKLIGGESSKSARGQQDEWAHHADGEWAGDACGDAQGYAAVDSDAVGESGEAGGELRRYLLSSGAAQALDDQPSADGACGEGEDAEHPEGVEPG
jgi:hypothetical protein